MERCSSSTFAKVVVLRGEAWLNLGPGASPIKKGACIPVGTQITTGEDSVLKLEFADGSTHTVGSQTAFIASGCVESKKAHFIDLLKGRIRATVKNGTKLQINTWEDAVDFLKTVALGVRGTVVSAEVTPDGSMGFEVSEGAVAIGGIGNEDVLLEAGQKLSGCQGCAPRDVAETNSRGFGTMRMCKKAFDGPCVPGVDDGCVGCGDGTLAPTEACDQQNFQGLVTCADFGFTHGELNCTELCTVDTSACFNEDPGPDLYNWANHGFPDEYWGEINLSAASPSINIWRIEASPESASVVLQRQ